MANKKVTEEMKKAMKEMKKNEMTNKEIGRTLELSESVIQYHTNEDQRKKAIRRAIKNQKPRDRKKYMREYHAERYRNDTAFRERMKKANRDNQKKKYWEKKSIE